MKDKTATPTEGKLPEPLLDMENLPANLPRVTQAEVVICANAKYRSQVARAAYETHRASITFRLLLGCGIEPGDMSALLNSDGELVLSRANVQ